MRSSRGVARSVILAIFVAGCATPPPSPSYAPSASPAASASSAVSTGEPSGGIASLVPAGSASVGHPIASTGSIAVQNTDGSLSIVATDGSSRVLSDTRKGQFGFPSWSPDGSQIAVVRSDGTNNAVVVFDAADATTGAAEPTVVFLKPSAAPFYVYWTPDGKSVSFLVNENDKLSLRVAPADGSGPVDGSGEDSLVRSGNPLYFDWLDRDRLFAHIGTGSDGFLGEIAADGTAKGASLKTPGDFRTGIVSADHQSIAFVRGAIGGPGEVIVSGRDGSNEQSMTVYGQTALTFDPTGGSVASIASATQEGIAGFPLGPLKLIDAASGDVRTLVDGAVVAFWWSPDGKTIAALRVQPSIASATPSAAPSQEPATEVRLIFSDVASGETLSQPIVRPAERFVSSLLAYFDQYALSHRLWAPDSTSILLPEVDEVGRTHVIVRYVDGSDPIQLDGDFAFWSP
ncbi:MAG: TolB family protein [Chloroflexota bacterium]